jgi:hypothetical protein
LFCACNFCITVCKLLFTSKKLWTFRYTASGLLISSIIICEEVASMTAAEQFFEESEMKC